MVMSVLSSMIHLDTEVLCFTLTEYVCIAFMTNLDMEVDVYLEWVCRYCRQWLIWTLKYYALPWLNISGLRLWLIQTWKLMFISNEYVNICVCVYLEWVCRYLHLCLSRMSMSSLSLMNSSRRFAFVFISNEYVDICVND